MRVKPLAKGEVYTRSTIRDAEKEVTEMALMDFYCGDVRSAKMLKRALARLEYTKKAPLKAENPHEMARALEVKSLIDVAEFIIVASLERKESRDTFRRADYPKQDDINWACILLTQKEGDGFKFTKIPLGKLKGWKAEV
jgi:succinate dehydrogenase/fumarate reductase flavoprotein subunit